MQDAKTDKEVEAARSYVEQKVLADTNDEMKKSSTAGRVILSGRVQRANVAGVEQQDVDAEGIYGDQRVGNRKHQSG